jgi:hypothetical protein
MKRRIAREIGWLIFAIHERGDIVPRKLPFKHGGRQTHCYECNGSLYSDIHYECAKCGWLICPFDLACGCHYNYESRPEDFY